MAENGKRLAMMLLGVVVAFIAVVSLGRLITAPRAPAVSPGFSSPSPMRVPPPTAPPVSPTPSPSAPPGPSMAPPADQHGAAQPDQTPVPAAQSCLSNMKQLMLANLMNCQDYNEVLVPHTNWQPRLMPYIKSDLVFGCPAGGKYDLAAALSGRPLGHIAQPAETIDGFEVSLQGKPIYPHDTKASIGFLDGHVRACTAYQVSRLQP